MRVTAANDREGEVVQRGLRVETTGRRVPMVNNQRVGRPAAVFSLGAGEGRRLIVVRHEEPVRRERPVRLVVGAVGRRQNERAPVVDAVGRDRPGAYVVAGAHSEEDLPRSLFDQPIAVPAGAGGRPATAPSGSGARNKATGLIEDEVARYRVGDARGRPVRDDLLVPRLLWPARLDRR